MIRFRNVVLVAAFVALLVAGTEVALAQGDRGAGEHFSVRDVQGPTAFAFDGFLNLGTPTAPVNVPLASVGRFVADGAGNIRDGVRTLVVGGAAIRQQMFECTYTVNPNGTGTAHCEIVGAPDEDFDFVIVERKQRAFFTAITPGITIRGETKRQQ